MYIHLHKHIPRKIFTGISNCKELDLLIQKLRYQEYYSSFFLKQTVGGPGLVLNSHQASSRWITSLIHISLGHRVPHSNQLK